MKRNEKYFRTKPNFIKPVSKKTRPLNTFLSNPKSVQGTKCPQSLRTLQRYEVSRVRSGKSTKCPDTSSFVTCNQSRPQPHFRIETAEGKKGQRQSVQNTQHLIYHLRTILFTSRTELWNNLQQSLIDSKSHQIFRSNYIHNLGLNNTAENRVRQRSPDLLETVETIGSFSK